MSRAISCHIANPMLCRQAPLQAARNGAKGGATCRISVSGAFIWAGLEFAMAQRVIHSGSVGPRVPLSRSREPPRRNVAIAELWVRGSAASGCGRLVVTVQPVAGARGKGRW